MAHRKASQVPACLSHNPHGWAGVHPALVTIPVDWNFSVPYGILYQLQPNDSIRRFLSAIRDWMDIRYAKATV